MALQLVWPAGQYLDAYLAALQRGWLPDNVRGEVAAREEMALIAADPADFLASRVDREAAGGPILLPDGTSVPRLPGYHRWLWDGEFCGMIGFRWQPGSNTLPPTCLGHIGYAVVPWKRGLGYAKQALALLLPEARAEGLDYVELSTEPDNMASIRVIEANGGELVQAFQRPAQYGDATGVLYRINL